MVKITHFVLVTLAVSAAADVTVGSNGISTSDAHGHDLTVCHSKISSDDAIVSIPDNEMPTTTFTSSPSIVSTSTSVNTDTTSANTNIVITSSTSSETTTLSTSTTSTSAPTSTSTSAAGKTVVSMLGSLVITLVALFVL